MDLQEEALCLSIVAELQLEIQYMQYINHIFLRPIWFISIYMGVSMWLNLLNFPIFNGQKRNVGHFAVCTHS